MDYYTRDQLPVISFEEEPEFLDRAAIRQALCEKPCNLVFVEVRNKLCGLISYGDVARAGKGPVPVNRNFTALRGKQLVKAREILHEKENIREIPATDEDGRLIGMFSQSDDLLYLEYNNPWEGNRYVDASLKKWKTIRFVRPPKNDFRRQRIVDRWLDEIRKHGVSCELIDFKDVPELQRERNIPILIADEETNVGARSIIEALDGDEFYDDVVYTLRFFGRLISGHSYNELIVKLADSGIKIYNMYFTRDETTEGRRRLWKGMRNWLKQSGARYYNPNVIPSCAQDFYGELNVGDYAAEVGNLQFSIETNNVYTRMKDVQSRYLNVVNGERVTVGQPSEAERTVWFFGPCLMVGAYVEDKHTIESFLQERFNREGFSCKVVNCGCFETTYQRMIRLVSTPMKPGDVAVLYVDNLQIPGVESIDLTDVLDRNNVPAGWLLNQPLHGNHKVNQIYADELFDRMVRGGVLTSKASKEESKISVTREFAVNTLYLDVYYDDFHPKEGEVVGSVGMHGNPFTLGHRYLIETASKQVDRLFVLMIEDELGLFSYAERFAMAVEGTKDLPNVRIVTGGPFQATRNVFREYFVQVEPSDIRESAVVDTQIFAEAIAKRLGITRRFLGDERHNPKMQFFNELMKEMLPDYGIEVIEIPRAQAGGRSISASLSREAAANGDRETLLANVPKSTLKFLLETEE